MILFPKWNFQTGEEKQAMTHVVNDYTDNYAQESCHPHTVTSDEKCRKKVVYDISGNKRFAAKYIQKVKLCLPVYASQVAYTTRAHIKYSKYYLLEHKSMFNLKTQQHWLQR